MSSATSPEILVSSLSQEISDLVDASVTAREKAYAPYSKFKVGTALLDEQNRVHLGCNVENASYSAVICAERTAISKMISEVGSKITKIVIITSGDEPCFPCGVCLQVIGEFGRDCEVYAVSGDAKRVRVSSHRELLPAAFLGVQLKS